MQRTLFPKHRCSMLAVKVIHYSLLATHCSQYILSMYSLNTLSLPPICTPLTLLFHTHLLHTHYNTPYPPTSFAHSRNTPRLLCTPCPGHVTLASLLCSAGADLETPDELESYATPLHGAVRNTRVEIVQLLLALGASPHAKLSVDGTCT